MYHFFVPAENISDSQVVITGGDFNHIKNVLRMKPNENSLPTTAMGQAIAVRFVNLSETALLPTLKKDSSKAASFLYASFCFKACRKQTKWS